MSAPHGVAHHVVQVALHLADRAAIIDQGDVVHESSAAALLADQAIQERYCAV